MFSTIVTLSLYLVLATVVGMIVVMGSIAIWWLRQAASPIPWLSLGIAPFFLVYTLYLFQKPTLIEVLVLAGAVFFNTQLVMETCPSRQQAARARAAQNTGSQGKESDQAR